MHHKSNRQFLFCRFLSILILFAVSLFLPALADNQASPGETTTDQGVIPAPGGGAISPPVTPGDGQWQSLPTNNQVFSTSSGTSLTTASEMCAAKINLLLNEPTQRTRVVLTFQPDSLTQQQMSAVQNILGAAAFNSDQPYQNIMVSQQQLTAMQNILYPYPATGISAVPMKNGIARSWISTDSPASGYPQYASTTIQPVLKVVPQFCRYLVVLGVVCACLFLIFAAQGIIFGQHNAGIMVVKGTAGIMLLLMAYSIWKVVRFNALNARGPDVPVSISAASPSNSVSLSSNPASLPSIGYTGDFIIQKGQPNLVPLGQANLPSVPNTPTATNRSGLPLQPLGAAH